MKVLFRLVFGVLAAGLFASWSATAKTAIVPLPQLGNGPVELRLAHAVNPRLTSLDPDELATLLAETRQVVRDHFNIKLRFSEPIEISVKRLLAAIPAEALKARSGLIYDFKGKTGDRSRLVWSHLRQLTKVIPDLAEAIAYARPHLVTAVAEPTYKAFAEALVSTHLHRLDHWRDLRTQAGGRVMDSNHANEWIVWDLLGYSGMPYDVIVTNRHSPDSLLVRGNHTTVPPSRERGHFRGHPMT